LLVDSSAKTHHAGRWAAIRCRIDRVWLGALRRLFGFEAWHASAPYSCRPYKRVVVELANALRPHTVVEIGCGLGDIVSRITAVELFAFDRDARVIKAARFLHGGRIHWIHGDAFSIHQSVPVGLTIDCLVMVNWIHSLAPEELRVLLTPLLPCARYMILDAIDTDCPQAYRYRHDFGFLAHLTKRVSVARAPSEPRSFIVFEIIK
jgi:SAM-dependent methyltransferase